MKRVLAVLAMLVWPLAAFGDAPLQPPSRLTRWSANRRYVAVADPKRHAVTVYRVAGRERTELWATPRWERSFDVADDGDHLVACYSGLNLLPLDYKPEWTMIEFYKRGKLIRAWSLRELVPDLGKLERTVSHYSWGSCVGFNAKGLYEVRTVDRGSLRFDVRRGALAK
jgi:hypothetical protein